jgi:ceramide glucosyltransferase
MAITYQFMPGAILGKAGRLAEPCFGSTIAIRADVLARTGGFAAFADHLADDYEIGAAVRRLGLKIALPPITVAHICDEADARALIERELRWGRVVRQISPLGYAGSLITYPLPLMVLGAALLGFSGAAMLLLLATLASRLVFKLAIDFAAKAPAGRWWLMPVSDTLAFGLFLASFGVNRVDWRGARFRVSREGALLPS